MTALDPARIAEVVASAGLTIFGVWQVLRRLEASVEKIARRQRAHARSDDLRFRDLERRLAALEDVPRGTSARTISAARTHH